MEPEDVLPATGPKVQILGTSPTCVTLILADEDHTLGNALRYVLAKKKAVQFCGYSIPHPSEAKMNLRVQTSGGVPALQVVREALVDLMSMAGSMRKTFDAAVAAHGAARSATGMDEGA